MNTPKILLNWQPIILLRMKKNLIDFLLYFKYHFFEAKVINGKSFPYKIWALKRFVVVFFLGRKKAQNFLLPFDTEVENSFGKFFIPKNSDLVLTVSSKSEADLLKYFHIQKGKVFLDIGANAGKYSIYLGRNQENIKVYSFEPSPSTFNILKRNIELNDLNEKVRIFNIGISEKVDELQFANSRSATGLSYIISDEDKKLLVDGFEITTVKVRSLDGLLSKEKVAIEDIELIKIDVENHEKSVISGAIETLNRLSTGSRVLIEIFPDSKDLGFILNLIISKSFKHQQINEEYHLFTKL